METLIYESKLMLHQNVALNYSPQGDGNKGWHLLVQKGLKKSHLTIPRKGMETGSKRLLLMFPKATRRT